MTSGLNNYFQALEETRTYLDPPTGLSNYNVASDAEVIKQSNIIIQILIQIGNELEQLDHKIRILEEIKDSDGKIESLIAQINNLKLGQDTSKLIKKKNRESILFEKI